MLTRFLLPILGTTVLVTGCASSSQYPINESYGPEPKLPEPKTSLFPTVNIAPAQGWPSGVMPTALLQIVGGDKLIIPFC